MWIPNVPTTILSAVTATAGFVCIYKDMHSGPPYDRGLRADDKTVIITGANTGIGKEAAWEFATRGAKVFMACRDMTKCETVRREIVTGTNNKFVYCRPLDLASLQSVRQFVDRFKSEEPFLDVLVNNAGVLEHEQKLTRDGFETHLGVNHMGHFLLTNLLLDTLKKSAPSRVVIVSSKAHEKATIVKEDLNWSQRAYDPVAAYNCSKLANVLFGIELGRRLLESKVSVSIVNPGLTDTDLNRNLPMSKSVTRYLIYPFFWPSMKSPRKGAQVIVHAALDPDLEGEKGGYYVDMQKAKLSKEAEDLELADWLWRVSEKWTKLHDNKDSQETTVAASKAA